MQITFSVAKTLILCQSLFQEPKHQIYANHFFRSQNIKSMPITFSEAKILNLFQSLFQVATAGRNGKLDSRWDYNIMPFSIDWSGVRTTIKLYLNFLMKLK